MTQLINITLCFFLPGWGFPVLLLDDNNRLFTLGGKLNSGFDCLLCAVTEIQRCQRKAHPSANRHVGFDFGNVPLLRVVYRDFISMPRGGGLAKELGYGN